MSILYIKLINFANVVHCVIYKVCIEKKSFVIYNLARDKKRVNVLKKNKLNQCISNISPFVKNRLDGVITLLMCLTIGIICLSKGGFYKEDILFPTTLICLFGAIFVFARLVLNITDTSVKKKSIFITLLDVFMILMPFSYALPLIFNKAVSIENSYFELLRYVNFAIVYFVARTTLKKSYLTMTIIICSILVGIFGIDEITSRTLEPYLSFVNARYLSQFNGRLSSFIQYANVSAAILLLGSFVAQSEAIKHYNETNVRTNLKKGIFLYIAIFLQICMILTESRMNFVISLVVTLAFSIYFGVRRKYKSMVACTLSCIVAIICSSIMDFCITLENYILVYIVLAIVFILCATMPIFLMYLNGKLKYRAKPSRKISLIINGLVIITIVFLVCIVFTVGQDLVIDVSNTTGETIRYLYNVLSGEENNISISYTYEPYSEESYVTFFIYEVTEDNKIENIWQKTISNEILNDTLDFKVNVKDTTKVLELIIQSGDCKIVIDEFKLNDKESILSYKYFPDELMFRLKNTGVFDAENEARYIYYEDALKLIKMSYLFGQGGEAFLTRYQEVQESGYISSEVHSHPLQIAIEAGIIGFIVYVVIIVITLIIGIFNIINYFKMLKNIQKGSTEYINIDNKLNFQIYILLLFISLIIISMFDLTFSFGVTICMFAILIGLTASLHLTDYPKDSKLCYTVDDKSIIALSKTIGLTVVLVFVCIITVYSVNIYRAGIIKLPSEVYDENKTNIQNLNVVNKRINSINAKLRLDKYNLDYMTALCDEYSIYINILRSMYLNSEEDSKEQIDKQIAEATIAQKQVADRIIECEYYNKYALYTVAQCYFSNYLYYAEIYQDNFESAEGAYAFYLNYALNLTERIKKIGPKNQVVSDMYNNIHEKYIDELERQQIYLNSVSVQNVLYQMKENIKEGN